ncbi:MAG: gonadoliberin III [Lysobacteraceae bacterium]|nr:MAG: gonadoliberin III [Xanthomonadaceae bacterium]
MSRRLTLFAVAAVLASIGIGLSVYRHVVFDVPWLPGQDKSIWSIEAAIEFRASGQPITVNMVRPVDQAAFSVLEESGASPGYGLSFEERNNTPVAQWTIRQAEGQQRLFYRVDVLQRDASLEVASVPPPRVLPVTWEEPYATAVAEVLEQAHALSADELSLTKQLIAQFSSAERTQNVQLLVDQFGQDDITGLLARMLRTANIPAATIHGLVLEDGRRRQTLRPLLRVWVGEDSEIFPLGLDEEELERPLLIWTRHDGYTLDVMGGTRSRLSFSMIRSEMSSYGTLAELLGDDSDWLGFSIHSLPIEEQAMFQTILLLPMGALVVCLLRILIGIRTSGTFMPVLIALAFIQTSLVTGLIGFLLVVATGLMIRSYLSHLNLLLVARISAVIITVIMIIGLFSVFSYKVGLTEGLKITFFPMIILSWTVERMSILWEEEGWHEVMVQAGGSLLTAVMVYLVMMNPWVRHLSFNFIGLQFVVLALIVLIGNYSGYRLLELRRFRVMAKYL